MQYIRKPLVPILTAVLLLIAARPAQADDITLRIAAGDGYIRMADGRPMYIFSFSDWSHLPAEEVMAAGLLAATVPAPIVTVDEGDNVLLLLTNVGLVVRPDLFDAHSVHWHGFPNAAPVFDGVPDTGISIMMGATLPYFYNMSAPGTYAWHCHVEATEHMQMGMIGNWYVRPAQNKLPDGTDLDGFTHHTGYKYVFNDGDGSTYYDVEFPIQLSSMDSKFHDASETVQPLMFNAIWDDYPLINGRGYPDTVNPGALTPPAENGGKLSQVESALIEATQGEIILLRVTNMSIMNYFTIMVTGGLPMKVVGRGAMLLRGPDGKDLYYETSSLTLGGGENKDVLIDTTGIAPGRYFLYTSNLNYLSNNEDDFGGMMTEIVIHP